VFCSFYDLVLKVGIDIHKVITVASHPDDKVPVFLRILLSLAKNVCADNIQLNMMAVEFKV
jgi:hypothetical protein